jgi:hypothetical protein
MASMHGWLASAGHGPAAHGLCMLCRLMLIGFGVIESENTVRAVSREGDRCADLVAPML